jgi:indole-3-acetate monooxygenase
MNIEAPIAKGLAIADPVQRARQLRPLIEEAARAIERDCALPPELLAALHDAGLFRLLLPRSCGGEEVEPRVFVAAVEEVAKADASTAWCISQGSGCSMTAAYTEPTVAREIFGGREAVLAWGPGGPHGKAIPVENGYLVSGTWSYASGIRHAQWLGGHSQLVNAQGRPCLGPDGKPVERTMLFPKSKATVHDVWQVMGLKGTGSDSYTVTDLFVPARYTFTREAPADRREAGPLYRCTSYQLYGSGFAGVALGIARATLDAFIHMAGAKAPCSPRSRCGTMPSCNRRSRSPRRNGGRRAPISCRPSTTSGTPHHAARPSRCNSAPRCGSPQSTQFINPRRS